MAGKTPRIAIPVLSGGSMGNYLEALRALGAAGTLVSGAREASAYDGLLLPGGWDADPALYGQANAACLGVDRALDDLQLDALDRFVRAGRPVLGVCRGHQLINIYFGGTLVQHLPQSPRHSRDPGGREDKAHPTRAAHGSFLARLYGEAFAVNSSHHQGADALGAGLEAVQWSDDGVIEGLEHRTLPVAGVQWHPERMCLGRARPDTADGRRVIEWFIEMCRGNGGM